MKVWRVRVVIEGAILHALSATKPQAEVDIMSGKLCGLDWSPIENTKNGDTLGWVEWPRVNAVSWREDWVRVEPRGRSFEEKMDDDDDDFKPAAAAKASDTLAAVKRVAYDD